MHDRAIAVHRNGARGRRRPPEATGIWQEGIRIAPLKLRAAGVFAETLMKLLKLNVRVPEIFLGDLGTQIAA